MFIHRLALLAALAAPAAAQQVHIVGPPSTPGPHFESVQAAIDAAADGDVIVIQPGDYGESVALVNRHLVLAGRTGPEGERATVLSLVIRDLAPERSVIVRGLDTFSFFEFELLAIEDCDGSVLVEDLQHHMPFNLSLGPSRIERSGRVVIARSTLLGTAGQASLFSSTPGGTGLLVEDSNVALYHSLVSGGRGAAGSFIFPSIPTPASEGGTGLHVVSGAVVLAGSEVHGGQGGSGNVATTPCSPPADGGPGLTGDGLVRRLEAVIAGGAAGLQPGCGADASPGVDQAYSGAIVTLPESPFALEISSPVEEGGTCTVSAQGSPFAPVLLLQALAPLGNWVGGLKGTLASAPPLVVYVLQLGADGTLSFAVSIPVGLLPPGLDALVLVDQLVSPSSTGGGLLSGPSSVLLVRDLP